MSTAERPQTDLGTIFVAPVDLGEGPRTVAIKDSIDVAGIPTRHGSAVYTDAAPAAANADVVSALLADRWRIVGKTSMHELAFGVTGINPAGGTPRNPGWPDRIPGGSSSGSAAAVAAGLVDAAIGSDTGGSIRMPAACCGVIGFKPTFGLVSRRGAHPASSSLDCVGPMARSVAMIEAVMSAIASGFHLVKQDGPIKLARVLPPCDPIVAAAFVTAISASGAVLEAQGLPLLDEAFEAGLAVIGAENAAAYSAIIDHPDLGEDVRQRLLAAREITSDRIAAAEEVRSRFAQAVDDLLERHDAIALPTLPIVPPLVVDAADARACVPLTRFVRPFNLSGHPAITLPIESEAGLPCGLQLVGRRGGDARLCAIAATLHPRLVPHQSSGE